LVVIHALGHEWPEYANGGLKAGALAACGA
jgi:hypothetical protein